MAIKELFKSLADSVKTATSKAVNKIDATVDAQKLKYRISKIDEEIGEIYKTLGEKIIASVYAEENFDEIIAETIAKIEDLKEERAKLDAERLVKENNVVCGGCGEEISRKNSYCPKCGHKNEDIPETENHDEQPFDEE